MRRRARQSWVIRLSRVMFWALVIYIVGGLLFECGRRPWQCDPGTDPDQVEAANHRPTPRRLG